MALPVINEIPSMNDFRKLLQNNPGVIVIKFGATWCQPCKKADPVIKHSIDQMPDTVQCVVVDVDESFEVYAYMKNKKMVSGIPALVAYYKENGSFIPDEFCMGAKTEDINAFFAICFKKGMDEKN
jgi:thioredoxin-like negative regulator of GroEL